MILGAVVRDDAIWLCCCSQAGTDIAHSGLRARQHSAQQQDSRAAARDGYAAVQEHLDKTDRLSEAQSQGNGRCVGFDEAPRYLRREFIMSGYYIGEL